MGWVIITTVNMMIISIVITFSIISIIINIVAIIFTKYIGCTVSKYIRSVLY
jgi:hypothetical protein